MVAAGRSHPDGADLRIVAPGGLELDRVLDPESSWNLPGTLIWFSTVEPIAVGETATYEVYFGNPDAGAPPDDPALVFPFFDAFDGTNLDPEAWVLLEGSAEVSGGELTVGPATRLHQDGTYLENTIWEVKSRLSQRVGARMVWFGGSGEQATMSLFADDSDHHAESNGFLTHFAADAPTDFHVWRIAREGSTGIHFFQDLVPIATHQIVPLGFLQPYLANETDAASMIYDWIRIRAYVNPEPEIALGAPQSIRGGLPSTWSHRKIMAFRADAFEWTGYAESLAAETTTSTIFVPKTELTSEPPPDLRSFVSIQSMRISGVSSPDARKAGELRANGLPLLATSHKINRTSEDATGYHHVAGVVDLNTSGASLLYQNGFHSPDGISVRAAESVIILLRLPAP
jgi:hypothetical protein